MVAENIRNKVPKTVSSNVRNGTYCVRKWIKEWISRISSQWHFKATCVIAKDVVLNAAHWVHYERNTNKFKFRVQISRDNFKFYLIQFF